MCGRPPLARGRFLIRNDNANAVDPAIAITVDSFRILGDGLGVSSLIEGTDQDRVLAAVRRLPDVLPKAPGVLRSLLPQGRRSPGISTVDTHLHSLHAAAARPRRTADDVRLPLQGFSIPGSGDLRLNPHLGQT